MMYITEQLMNSMRD